MDQSVLLESNVWSWHPYNNCSFTKIIWNRDGKGICFNKLQCKFYLIEHILAVAMRKARSVSRLHLPLPSSQILHCTGRSVFPHKHKMKHCLWCDHSQSVLCCCKRSLKNNDSVMYKGGYKLYQILTRKNAGTNLNKEENCSISQISDTRLVHCLCSSYHKRKPVHHPPHMGIDKCVLR